MKSFGGSPVFLDPTFVITQRRLSCDCLPCDFLCYGTNIGTGEWNGANLQNLKNLIRFRQDYDNNVAYDENY